MKLTEGTVVYLPDMRDVTVSRYGKGNVKIGPDVFTYSRIAGRYELLGTCPGSTPECEEICYAKRIRGDVKAKYYENSYSEVPPIPEEARLLRIHVSGDFDSPLYIGNWFERLRVRADVTAWAYTRSWRVPSLLSSLEHLRSLPNVQLFASMDVSAEDMPPPGWRIAWIDGDPRAGRVHGTAAHEVPSVRRFAEFELQYTASNTKALICPEETKSVKDCQECGFCFDGKRNDVIFLRH